MILKKKNKRFENLVIVAHPDDELIFYGSQLIRNNLNKILCLTHANTPRFNEFSNLLNELKCPYIILDHKDDMRIKYMKNEYRQFLFEYIKKNKNKLKQIVTHNPFGEYGHNFHKAVSNVVIEICKELNVMNKLHFFSICKKRLPQPLIDQKYSLMSIYYKTQTKVIERLGLKKYMEYECVVNHLNNVKR